ncbi:MAG TPA: aldehyde dehydrogenase family protein, partial [Gemmatimonadaceae bacterium]|nr:aldehyde dehydrogenase family protein [Gemmatimonadaceae bacterium]
MTATDSPDAVTGVVPQPAPHVVLNYIGGQWVESDGPLIDVHDPATGSVIARTPLSPPSAVEAAVAAARAAFPKWSTRPIRERVQIFYRYRALLEQHLDELSSLIVKEHGKVMSEARAEVLKAIELTEFACSLPQLATGEILEVSSGVECRSERVPVG